MLKPLLSAGLVVVAGLVDYQAQAVPLSGGRPMQLECKSQYTTSNNPRDPITAIKLSLTDGNAHIVHVAQSGRTFDRADQYGIKSAFWTGQQFAWSGTSSKS